MAMLPYVTTKRIIIDYNWAGLMYYCLYAAIIAIYGRALFETGGYLKKEDVVGLVNPYVQASTHPVKKCEDTGDCASVYSALSALPYCSSEALSYHYDSVFKYTSAESSAVGPECQATDVYEVSTKNDNLVTFSTVFLEWQTFAWPCHEESLPFAVQAIAACAESNHSVVVEPSGQCSCKLEKAVFPVAIEDYTIKMPHSYIVHDLNSQMWRGSSALLTPAPHLGYPTLMDTVLHFPNNTNQTLKPGDDIALTLKDILNMVHLDLDQVNQPSGEDSRPSYAGRYPTFRQTGLSLNFDIEYTNRDRGEVIIAMDKKVDAKVTIENETTTWSSIGPQTTYSIYPTGKLGNQTYHRIIRYPQDVKIKFRAHGFVYAFDPATLLTAIIDLIVLTRIAALIMDMMIFYILPYFIPSLIVLKNKRAEKVTRRAAFMEMGIQSAVAVNQFKRLKDMDDNAEAAEHEISFADLASVFGFLPEVDKEHAMMIGKTVLGKKARKGKGLDFNQFMTIMHGDAITFSEYLNEVDRTGGNLKKLGKLKADAERGYDEAARSASIAKSPSSTPSVAATSASAASPAVQVVQMVAPAPVHVVVQQQPAAAPATLICYNCKKQCGIPPGAVKVACPFCGAVNSVTGQPYAAPQALPVATATVPVAKTPPVMTKAHVEAAKGKAKAPAADDESV